MDDLAHDGSSSPAPPAGSSSRRDRLLIGLLDADPSALLLQREVGLARVLAQATPLLVGYGVQAAKQAAAAA